MRCVMNKLAVSRTRTMWLVLTISLLIMAGCGGPYDASVYGVVSIEGNNLPRGTVAFYPKGGGSPGYGQVKSDGTYSVRTGRENGISSGEYAVTIAANEPPESLRSETGGPPLPGKPITPLWYRSVDTSGLQYRVEPGSNEIDISLTSEAPPDWNPPRKRRRRSSR